MADISTMTLLDGSEFGIKDATARTSIVNLTSDVSGKVNISQGTGNAGKVLGIDNNGNVTPVNIATGSGDVSGPNSSVDEHVVIFDGTTGKTIQDSGFTIGASVPSDAVFTDTTYESRSAVLNGTDVSLVTTGEKYIWNNKTDNVGTVTGVKMNNGSAVSPDASGIVDLGVVITSHQDISGKADIEDIPTKVSDLQNDSGFLTSHQGASDIVSKINAGSSSISVSKVDLSTVKGVASGLAELDSSGKVPAEQLPSIPTKVSDLQNDSGFLTSHQGASDIVSKINAGSSSISVSKVDMSTIRGVANGLAELDANGKVQSSQLPSYVDDVLEYSSLSAFPLTGETGKIYIALDSNKTYRWGGSDYAEISASLALGTTSSTAFRGDHGNTAYEHATDSSRLTTAQTSGLYKIATTAEGHVASVTAVQKSDLTALGVADASDVTSLATDVNGKINSNQGTANAGKFLVVNSSGIVEPVSMTAWQGGSY